MSLKVVNHVTDLIGDTPMIKINKLVDKQCASVYAKLEWYNISGSVKDRMALYLIEYAEAVGKPEPYTGRDLLDRRAVPELLHKWILPFQPDSGR